MDFLGIQVATIVVHVLVNTDIVEAGAITDTQEVIMLAPTVIKQYNDKILTQLFRFSIDIVFLLLIASFVFARVLKKSEHGHPTVSGIMDGIWHMIQMMLNQVCHYK